MAKDKDNGKKAKGASKKGKKEPMNWAKVAIPLLLVFIMVGSIFALLGNKQNSNDTGANKKFDNIMDGLRLIPANASSVRYADLQDDPVLNDAQNRYLWLKGTLPSEQIFNANPQRNLFAIYPAGFFGPFTQQYVALTDFGTGGINQSWPNAYTINSIVHTKAVNPSNYYYTVDTTPVVSGRIENVADVVMVMTAGNASAYGGYSDLFDELNQLQIHTENSTLQIAGKASNLSYSDRYYTALGPVDPTNKSASRLYSYVAILHLNATISDKDKLNLALLEQSMEKMGFKTYRTQSYDGFIVIEATGSLDSCIDDMQNRWGFIKYQASL